MIPSALTLRIEYFYHKRASLRKSIVNETLYFTLF